MPRSLFCRLLAAAVGAEPLALGFGGEAHTLEMEPLELALQIWRGKSIRAS
jgi:hypothetical protein